MQYGKLSIMETTVKLECVHKPSTTVKSAYSSQECGVCHYPDRTNRPDQQTFCCVVCGFSTHADHNAALNLARRLEDAELRLSGKARDQSTAHEAT